MVGKCRNRRRTPSPLGLLIWCSGVSERHAEGPGNGATGRRGGRILAQFLPLRGRLARRAELSEWLRGGPPLLSHSASMRFQRDGATARVVDGCLTPVRQAARRETP